MYNPIMHIILNKPNTNQIWTTTKLYDPLLLKSLESFRELIIAEFYREQFLQESSLKEFEILVVKVKMEDGNYKTLNDELEWEQFVQQIVKMGQTLQFQVKLKPARKVYKKQLREIEQRLKELEHETQLLKLKKKIIELSKIKSEEKPQDPRDTLLESIRNGKKLKKTPTSTKIITNPRDLLMNSIKQRSNNSEN
ncbi:hypothetical protein NAEGRDRAFT_80209 [Naegleria gruberi]|uniref:WH2 domain-containing protein n=1 Tax=Naegleria gruberi TaxID=5762 RepID=D2VJN1_NAEGR|nr:uncharacterized protein NAEGRDRAFT_80209 [Naegleria gruberi]EFC42982.1 hypothetical protein NAEGRDRAFT_80209 [Naegleria gruberi]|eukprot:XP_002675726.1 hypothetical protein NAEGRDRAFT_80209 [Naegleria gruberi strain NEG-M]